MCNSQDELLHIYASTANINLRYKYVFRTLEFTAKMSLTCKCAQLNIVMSTVFVYRKIGSVYNCLLFAG